MIRTIIIDDEPPCIRNLAAMLQRYCPQVAVVATCESGEQGIERIGELKPDLVFLDVEMPVLNGFDMLARLKQIDFDLVFTTSYDEYALRAFKVNAVDYLLKPIDREELIKAVSKIRTQPLHQPLAEQLQNLLHSYLAPNSSPARVALPSSDGLQFIAPENILSCESEDNYTHIRLKEGQKLLISITLGDVEQMLPPNSFVRVHRSFLVNLKEIHKFIRRDGGYLVLSDGSEIPVSRYKKDELMKLFTNSR